MKRLTLRLMKRLVPAILCSVLALVSEQGKSVHAADEPRSPGSIGLSASAGLDDQH